MIDLLQYDISTWKARLVTALVSVRAAPQDGSQLAGVTSRVWAVAAAGPDTRANYR